MQKRYRSPALADSRNWAKLIYAHVLIRMVDDLEDDARHRADALRWFIEERPEVALVCAICEVRPVAVYREVARRLAVLDIHSWQIAFIRWRLSKGAKLPDITVPVLATVSHANV